MKLKFTLVGNTIFYGHTPESIQKELGCFLWLPSAKKIREVMSRQDKFTVLQLWDDGTIMNEFIIEVV